ncbi:hypothetical protein TNCV_2159031 [Trichonephila clavipes]|nr:hypothetical protein TNCV_2159031 [Trichonephila clavipes]
MSPTEERRDEGGNIRTRQNPFGPQERQTRIDKAKIQRVKTGGPRTLQRRNRQRKPQRRNRQRKPQRRNHQREVVNEINSSSEMRKTVKINGYDFDALIDTGSTITLIRESVHQILGRPTLNPTKIKLTSFDKLHELEESNLEKVDKLVKLEEKYEILQETLKITERRLVEKEIECASLTEKNTHRKHTNGIKRSS